VPGITRFGEASTNGALPVVAVERFARRWAAALAGEGRVHDTVSGLAAELTPLVARLARVVGSDQSDDTLARDICNVLVSRGRATAAVIAPTLSVLLDELIDDFRGILDGPAAEIARVRGVTVAAQVAETLTETIRTYTLAAQEEMQRAALAAVRAAEQERRHSEARFRALFNQAAAGIGIISTSGLVMDGNDTWSKQMGYPIDEMRGRPLADLVTPGSEPIALTRFQELVGGDRDSFRLEFVHVRRDGRPYVLDLSVSRVHTGGGEPDFLVGIAVDVTERKRLEEKLWHEARHDPLTGLPNRTKFFERLAAILTPPRPSSRVGVCYIDLDGFKSINDGLGHDVGDQLLVHVADRLGNAVATPSTLLARLGGDEFGIVVDGARGVTAREQAHLVLEALSAPFAIDGRELTISASVGVVDSPTAGSDVQAVMRAADISLYRAKARGRGRLELHDPRTDAHHVTRHALATEMAAALARGEFFLEYQPLVSLADYTVRRVEALLRWRHPVRGLLQPDRFIELAEENGQIGSLGLWAVRTACQAANEWQASCKGQRIGVNVNVAVGQLHDPDLPAHIAEALDESGLPPELLHLELTESAVLGKTSGPVDALLELANSGVGIVIDDFGTGYSNLGHLTRLPVSELKIASSFLPENPDRKSSGDKILPAVISLAHSLGLKVTAEGVENAAQVEMLRALGCDTGQGWYFGAPTPAHQVANLTATAVRID
jgi:diguanylate cyclase (GGDEF)-like protein/PAS domain S-box-containing protein